MHSRPNSSDHPKHLSIFAPYELLPSSPVPYKITHTIGSGAFGTVAGIELAGSSEKSPLTDRTSWVLKVVAASRFQPSEPYILAHYQPTFTPFNLANGKKAWITKRVPGNRLFSFSTKELDFEQTLILVVQLAMTLNQHQHDAVMHGDLKGENILFTISKDKQERLVTDLSFVDYGLAKAFKESDPNCLYEGTKKVDPGYFAPETYKQGQCGLKTDIYMIATVILHLLAAKNWPKTKPNVQLLYALFLKRMRSWEYKSRPDSDEVLKFFITMNLFYQLNKKDPHNIELKNEYAAKLTLLAYGQWYDKLENEKEEMVVDVDANKSQEIPVSDVKTPKAWANFDFSSEPEINRSIFLLARYENTNPPIFSELLAKPKLVQVLNILEDYKILNAHVIAKLRNDEIFLNELHEDISRPYYLINTLIQKYPSEFSSSQLLAAVKWCTMINKNIDLNFLSMLTGTVKERREKTLPLITYLLNQTENIAELDFIQEQLIQLKKEKKVDYLSKRQGYFAFSIHNHKWNGEKVSGTWVSLMALIEKRKKYFEKNESYHFRKIKN